MSGNKQRIFSRSKRRFKTARAAWSDIHRKTGRAAKGVIGTAHTARRWRFKLRVSRARFR